MTTAFLTLIFCLRAFFSFFNLSIAFCAPSISALLCSSLSCIFAVFARSSASAYSACSLWPPVLSTNAVSYAIYLSLSSSSRLRPYCFRMCSLTDFSCEYFEVTCAISTSFASESILCCFS